MWQIRTRVSFLLAQGHPDARDYPLSAVSDEYHLAVGHLNNRTATDAVAIQSAIGSILSKDAADGFSKLLKKLNGE